MSDLSERLSCMDGNCIGTINERGVCNVCGKTLRESQERSEQERREKERWTEGTMTDHVKHILSGLKTKYPITDTWSGEKGEFKVSGIDDTFYIDFLSCDHCSLSNYYSWHEHFIERLGEPYARGGHFSLEEFLDGLFAGVIQIKVKYRGNTPVAHQVRGLRGGRIETIRWTKLLRLESFFKKRWYKELEYNITNKQLNETTK
jgi:hypothetical protein